jgi:hypothetical protein
MRPVWLCAFFAAACFCAGCSDLDRLLDTPDDFLLCDELFKRALKHYGDGLDVSRCKEKDRTVLLVWHASGIIDNGGFQYLFEGDLKGDPDFAMTAAAFKAIKATNCAAAVEAAVKLFPGGKPPPDVAKRLKVYQSAGAAKRDAIDRRFFSESQKVKALLATYIRAHRAEFTHLR